MIRFVFWDVQHGHATYIKTDYQHIVVDLGVGSFGAGNEFSPLIHLKKRYGLSHLDGVIITHPHSDHLYDIFNFDELSPRVLWRPAHLTDEEIKKGNSSTDTTYVEKYIEISHRYNSPVTNDPFKSENNGGVEFKIFVPQKCSTSNLNNHSLVAVVSHAGSKMLIPGDNESASWNELLDDPLFANSIKDVDVILAPHHGREAGYSEKLFSLISPYITIVSDGAETDTSATYRYSKKSKGWKVHKRSGESEIRKCLTTRKDGVIVVDFGINSNSPYISVNID